MAKALISCPNCRKPVTADIEQLFDVGVDPSAKQRLLSGAFNQIQCTFCGYQGFYPSVIVYHDPSKELLMTFIPPDLNLPRNEQERVTGAMINQVVNNLPMEKRKGYLFNPQAALTMQGLVERILEADGITREMIQAQQQRLNLIQRLLDASTNETRADMARQEDALIDANFFTLLRQLSEAALMSGDQAVAKELESLQNDILPHTTFGREIQNQTKIVETVIRDLQAAGQNLTREKLLDIAVHAPDDTYLHALVSLTRAGMDYQFFQSLSERIDRARGDGRTRLTEIREKLLEWTREIDQQIEAHVQEVHKLFQAILNAEDVSEAMTQSLPYVDEYFLQELNSNLQDVRGKGDLAKLDKLQKMMAIIQQANQGSPEINLVEELLDVPEDASQKENWRRILDEHASEITPDFLSALASITSQVQDGNDRGLAGRIMELHRFVVRYSMERNLKAN